MNKTCSHAITLLSFLGAVCLPTAPASGKVIDRASTEEVKAELLEHSKNGTRSYCVKFNNVHWTGRSWAVKVRCTILAERKSGEQYERSIHKSLFPQCIKSTADYGDEKWIKILKFESAKMGDPFPSDSIHPTSVK